MTILLPQFILRFASDSEKKLHSSRLEKNIIRGQLAAKLKHLGAKKLFLVQNKMIWISR